MAIGDDKHYDKKEDEVQQQSVGQKDKALIRASLQDKTVVPDSAFHSQRNVIDPGWVCWKKPNFMLNGHDDMKAEKEEYKKYGINLKEYACKSKVTELAKIICEREIYDTYEDSGNDRNKPQTYIKDDSSLYDHTQSESPHERNYQSKESLVTGYVLFYVYHLLIQILQILQKHLRKFIGILLILALMFPQISCVDAQQGPPILNCTNSYEPLHSTEDETFVNEIPVNQEESVGETTQCYFQRESILNGRGENDRPVPDSMEEHEHRYNTRSTVRYQNTFPYGINENLEAEHCFESLIILVMCTFIVINMSHCSHTQRESHIRACESKKLECPTTNLNDINTISTWNDNRIISSGLGSLTYIKSGTLHNPTYSNAPSIFLSGLDCNGHDTSREDKLQSNAPSFSWRKFDEIEDVEVLVLFEEEPGDFNKEHITISASANCMMYAIIPDISRMMRKFLPKHRRRHFTINLEVNFDRDSNYHKKIPWHQLTQTEYEQEIGPHGRTFIVTIFDQTESRSTKCNTSAINCNTRSMEDEKGDHIAYFRKKDR